MKIKKVNNLSYYNSFGEKSKDNFYKKNNFPSFHGGFNNKLIKDNIKIVFSDIDGTISEHSDLMTKKTIDTVNALHNRGIPVVLTTARCYQDTLPISDQFVSKPDYTIALQGGELVNGIGVPVFRNIISPKTGAKLVKWFKSINRKDQNSHLIMYFNEQPYSLSNIQFPWKAKSMIKQVNSFDELFSEKSNLQKAVIYKSDAAQNSNYNQNVIIDSFNSSNIPDLKINPSSKSILEFQNNWVSKDKAIDFLLRVLKINPKNAMVIGDSYNDVEMMDFIKQNGGLSVAMGNANDNVKKHANCVTLSVIQDGFSNIIDKIFSI